MFVNFNEDGVLLSVVKAVLNKDVEISDTKKVDGLRGKLNKVVLAYSGGLDTSVVVPWLRYRCHPVLFLYEFSKFRFLFNLIRFDVYVAERTMVVKLFASLLI